MNNLVNPLPASRAPMSAFRAPLPDFCPPLPNFLYPDNFFHHSPFYYPQFNGGYHVHIHNFSPHPIITPESIPSEEGFSFHPDPPQPIPSEQEFSFHHDPSQSLTNPNPSTLPASPPILEGTYFPVTFFDGKNHIDVGNIFLHPFLDHKNFIMLISHKIGIPPWEISTFLIRRRPPLGLPSKILIDNCSDFAAISLELHCHFLATKKTVQLTRTQIREFRSMLDAAELESWEPEVTQPVKSVLNVEARSYEYPRELKVAEEAKAAASREMCYICLAEKKDCPMKLGDPLLIRHLR